MSPPTKDSSATGRASSSPRSRSPTPSPCPTSRSSRWPTVSPPSRSTGPRHATRCRASSSRALARVVAEADARDDVDVLILTGADPAFCAGSRPEGARRRRRPAQANAETNRAARGATGTPRHARTEGADASHVQADHRCRQRGGGDRRPRAGSQLRLPRGVGAGPLRRHPRPGGRASPVGADCAACPKRSASVAPGR